MCCGKSRVARPAAPLPPVIIQVVLRELPHADFGLSIPATTATATAATAATATTAAAATATWCREWARMGEDWVISLRPA